MMTMRDYLLDWANWVESWHPNLGFPRRVPYVCLMKPSLVHDGDGPGERVDTWAMQIVDACIESLPSMLSHAIYARYLRHVGASDAADMAERRLAELVKNRGILLEKEPCKTQ